jgi:DNA-directed RNA polymerase specialized sigma24 family protein
MQSHDTSISPKDDSRARPEEFVELREQNVRQPKRSVIDIDGMIGATGEQLSPLDADWDPRWGRNETDPDYYSPGMNFTENAAAYSDPETYEPEIHIAGAERALRMVAAEKAADASEQIRQAVTAMPEPVRTVAVNRIILGASPESLARGLNTSVETVEFLTQMAVSLLAVHVTIS